MSYTIEQLARDLNTEDALEFERLWKRENERWKDLEAPFKNGKRHFLVEDGHGGFDIEYWHCEVTDVDVYNRIVSCIDHSTNEKCYIEYPPERLFTDEEFKGTYKE